MKNTFRALVTAALGVTLFVSFGALGSVIKTFPRVTTTTNQTFTYYTADASTAQVTITADAGSPNGTVTVKTRQTAGGSPTTVVTYATPTGTKTYTGEAQGVLEVVVTGLSSGTIGIEVLTK